MRRTLFLMGAFFFALTALASDSFRGMPFSEPDKKVSMPEKWQKTPIKYEKWAEGADIALSLEQDLYYMILPLVEEYARQNNLKIAMNEGTCGIAAGMLYRRAIDIGGFCCPPGERDRLPGLGFHTLGIASKAFIVHPDNPVENISTEELRGIFTGRIYRWSELKSPSGEPGPDMILTVGRFHCPSRPGHWRLIFGDEDLFSRRIREVGTIPDMIGAVAKNPAAVGWEAPGMVERYKKDMGEVKALRIDGISPYDHESLASFKYGFYRTYSLSTWGGAARNPKAKKLVEYLIKEAGSIDSSAFGFASSERLRKAGWKFLRDELTGEPSR